MTGKKDDKGKTQDILSALFIVIIFIAVISIILIKLASITYEKEKTSQEAKQLLEENQNDPNIDTKENDDNKEQTIKKDTKKQIKIEPELTEEYVPIKFLWTGDNEGYWIKTDKLDKQWYSIEEGIYPTFAYQPQTIEMTFKISGEYKEFEVIHDWDSKLYIWFPKLEEEYNKSLFLEKEKGITLLYNNGWENSFNQTYNGREKINMLPEKVQEKLINSYKIYTDNMQNQNILDEENIEESNKENDNEEIEKNETDNKKENKN